MAVARDAVDEADRKETKLQARPIG
jgi:hypothetical protein